jgi:hypothetical protein
MGVLTSKKVANLKYFQAEKASPLFAELKNLIAKSLGASGALKTLLKTSGAKLAFVFGPYTESEDSDIIDLFLLGQAGTIADGLKDIEEKFGKKINVTEMSETDFKGKRESGEAELEKLLSGNKILLIGKL